MAVKRVFQKSKGDRTTFYAFSAWDDAIDYAAIPEGAEPGSLGDKLHAGETDGIPIKPECELIRFTLRPLTIDEIVWAEDQALANMTEGESQANSDHRFGLMKSLYAFRAACVRAEHVFEVGDVFDEKTLPDLFAGLPVNIQREMGRVALKRSTLSDADKKKS